MSHQIRPNLGHFWQDLGQIRRNLAKILSKMVQISLDLLNIVGNFLGWSDRVTRILEDGKPTPDLENSGFGGINPSPIAGEIGSVSDEWVGLTESLDSPTPTHSLQIYCAAFTGPISLYILGLGFKTCPYTPLDVGNKAPPGTINDVSQASRRQ